MEAGHAPAPPAGGQDDKGDAVIRLMSVLNGFSPPANQQQRAANMTCALKVISAIRQGKYGPSQEVFPRMWVRAADIARTTQNPWAAFMAYVKAELAKGVTVSA